MFATLLLLAALAPQGLSATPAGSATTTQPTRVEKLTPAELKQLTDSRQAVADAQAKLAEAKKANQPVADAGAKLLQAKRNLRGAMEGIEQSHHANTDCGCYIQTAGRDYDKVEFKGDTIVIHHIHEAPASLHQ